MPPPKGSPWERSRRLKDARSFFVTILNGIVHSRANIGATGDRSVNRFIGDSVYRKSKRGMTEKPKNRMAMGD